MRAPPTIVLFTLGLLACSARPWAAKGAPSEPPDIQFRTGVEVGYDAWVWECHEGRRVVITQGGSACFGSSAPRTSSGPCGAPLAVEADFPPVEGRHVIPEGYRWPGSGPCGKRPCPTVDASALGDDPPDSGAPAASSTPEPQTR